MNRCLELAALGAGRVAPNPMVGAVLVHNNRIIGEGYHHCFGEPHAEVNCIASVRKQDRSLIKDSVLYVSLEPCSHFGKTPPCTELIIESGIRKVIVGSRDPFYKVNGSGIQQLLEAGIETICGVIENKCSVINRRFFCFHTLHRPYILLKWAQTADGLIGSGTTERWNISNAFTNRLVHKWRSEEAAVLVGTQTALLDNPRLTLRLWGGKQPVRLVIDKHNRLPAHLHIFNGDVPTIVFNLHQHTINFSASHQIQNQVYYCRLTAADFLNDMLAFLHQIGILSVMVEGGAGLLQSFIDANLWDEARIIQSDICKVQKGVRAPVLYPAFLQHSEQLAGDLLSYFTPVHSHSIDV